MLSREVPTKVRVNQRGQLSLPSDVREHLRLPASGGTVELRVIEGGVQLVVPRAHHPFLKLGGSLRVKGILTDEAIEGAIARGASSGNDGVGE